MGLQPMRGFNRSPLGILRLDTVAPQAELRLMASVTAFAVGLGTLAMVGSPQGQVGLRFFLVALHTPVRSPVMAFAAVDDFRHPTVYLEPVGLLMAFRNRLFGVARAAFVRSFLAVMACQTDFHLRLSLVGIAMDDSRVAGRAGEALFNMQLVRYLKVSRERELPVHGVALLACSVFRLEFAGMNRRRVWLILHGEVRDDFFIRCHLMKYEVEKTWFYVARIARYFGVNRTFPIIPGRVHLVAVIAETGLRSELKRSVAKYANRD